MVTELITVGGNTFKYAGIFTGCTFLISGFFTIGPPLLDFTLRMCGIRKVTDVERFDELAISPATIQSDGKTVVEVPDAAKDIKDEKVTPTINKLKNKLEVVL